MEFAEPVGDEYYDYEETYEEPEYAYADEEGSEDLIGEDAYEEES